MPKKTTMPFNIACNANGDNLHSAAFMTYPFQRLAIMGNKCSIIRMRYGGRKGYKS